MSRKGRETSEEQKIIIKLHNQCKSLREIAQLVNRPRSISQSIIDRFCERKTVQNMPRSGRPQALSETDKRFIIRQIKIDPKTSAPKITASLENRSVHVAISTVRNVCHKNGYHGHVRKKFWINETNRKKRLEFAKQHLNLKNIEIQCFFQTRVNLIFSTPMEDVQCSEKKIRNSIKKISYLRLNMVMVLCLFEGV